MSKDKFSKRINRRFLVFMLDESDKSFAENMGIRGSAYLNAAKDYARGIENSFIEIAKENYKELVDRP